VRASATLMAARVRAAEDTILAMQLDQVQPGASSTNPNL